MKKNWMLHLDFITLDLFTLVGSYLLAWLLPYGRLVQKTTDSYRDQEMLIVLALFYLMSCFFTETHEDVVNRGAYREFTAVFRQVAIISLLYFAFYLYAVKDRNRDFLGMAGTFGLCWMFSMFFVRTSWKKYLSARYEKQKNVRQILVVTTQKGAEKMLPALADHDTLRDFEACGLVITDADMVGRTIGGIEVKANRRTMLDYAKSNVVDEVLLSLPGNAASELEMADEFLIMGITVNIYMQQQFERLPNKSEGQLFGYPVLTSSISRITFRQAFFKRLMDIAGGIVGLLLAVLVGIAVGPLIYIKSPGNILFSQIRVGKGGRKFRMYKFRSMYLDAEERKKELLGKNEIRGQMFKIKDDPRIIRGIGHFIRKTSLDEFPQFWNVLKGDMSLVGTRPPTVDEYEHYEMHHKSRLGIKPGITGMWQISGRSEIMDFEEVVKLDMEYIENYSLEMDIKILVKTVLSMFKGGGAA